MPLASLATTVEIDAVERASRSADHGEESYETSTVASHLVWRTAESTTEVSEWSRGKATPNDVRLLEAARWSFA